MPFKIGDVFQGTARIVDVRRGGMGVVYVCNGIVGDVDGAFAIKTYADIEERIRGSIPGQILNSVRERLKNRFVQEAKINLNLPLHPNIVTTYGIGHHHRVPFILMEYINGPNLRDIIERGPIAVVTAVTYACQIIEGLKCVYDTHKLLHQDIKPENILLTVDGTLKIADFGLARNIGDELMNEVPESFKSDGLQISVAHLLGTLPYMSPEQVRGNAADPRSDIFAFGAVLHEMITGVRPFRGDSSVETMNAILKEEPPPISVTALSLGT